MFKENLVKPSPANMIVPLFLVYFLLMQNVVADVEAEAFRYIARRLQPNECQRIINREAIDSSFSSKSSSNGIDCFRKLVNWASKLRINRRDTRLILGNRLHRIGRNDLAQWLVGPPARKRTADQQTIEYESWDSKNDSNPTISEMDRIIYGPPAIKSVPGLSPENHQQQSIESIPDPRKLNYGIHSLDSFKNRSLVMAEPQSKKLATSAPGDNAAVLAGRRLQERVNVAGTGPPKEVDDAKDETPTPSGDAETEVPEVKKHDKPKSSKPLSHFSDDKVAPCLRVPLSTALVVIGTIMILTCCCALLLRNRLAACFQRFRGQKTKTNSRRMSEDEEQGFMGPRTIGKVPKRSGRKGGGPTDVANVGIQKANNGSNASVRESDEPLTGCCNCCAKNKKKNKRKRSKK